MYILTSISKQGSQEARNQAWRSMPAIPTGCSSHQPPSHQDAPPAVPAASRPAAHKPAAAHSTSSAVQRGRGDPTSSTLITHSSTPPQAPSTTPRSPGAVALGPYGLPIPRSATGSGLASVNRGERRQKCWILHQKKKTLWRFLAPNRFLVD